MRVNIVVRRELKEAVSHQKKAGEKRKIRAEEMTRETGGVVTKRHRRG